MKQPTPNIPLTELVDIYAAASDNDDRKYYLNLLIHARWVWKQLFWSTLYVVKSKVLKVQRVSANLSYIPFPGDMARFYNICIEDGCNGLRALMMDESINAAMQTPSLPALPVCRECGHSDELTACINQFSLVTQDYDINGRTYTEKTWKKVLSNGDVFEVKETPMETVQPDGSSLVEIKRSEKILCQLMTKPCGCIADTPENRIKIMNQCGVAGITPHVQSMVKLLSKPYQLHGAVKLENNRIWIKGHCPDYVMVCYQTNGECPDEEIMVPEIAVDCMQYGIDYLCKRFSNKIGRYEKLAIKNEWENSKDELLMFLNPIRMEDFMDAQMSIPLWGNPGSGVSDCCEWEFKAEPVIPPAIPQPTPAIQPVYADQPGVSIPSTTPTPDNMTVINENFEVGAGAPIQPGGTTYRLNYRFIIKKSVNIEIDGASIPELNTNKRLAYTVVYDADAALITFNTALQQEQVVRITGLCYLP